MKFGKLLVNLVIIQAALIANSIRDPFCATMKSSQETKYNLAASANNSSEVISFDFGSETSTNDTNFSCIIKDGLLNSEFSTNGNIVSAITEIEEGVFKLDASFPVSEDGRLELIHSSGSSIAKGYLYSSKDKDGKYWISTISDSSAKRLAGTLDGLELMDGDQIKADFQKTPEISTQVIATGAISGFLKWTDEQGNTHPLVGAKVKLTMPGSWWAGETYSNSSGYYKISFDGIWTLWSYEPDLHIYAENEMGKITNKNGAVYEKAIKITDWDNNTNYSYSYIFNPNSDGDLGKSMMVFSGLYNYSEYASQLNGGAKIPQCSVVYPTDDTSTPKDKGAYYRNGNNEIRLGYESQKQNGYPSVYASWDTLGHEYGHHLQYHYFMQDYYGEHHAGTNDVFFYLKSNGIDDLGLAKKQGTGLAWKESWPTFFEISAQSSFNSDLKTISTVGDSQYISYNGVDFDMNSIIRRGEGDEETIMSFLYRLWDSNNSVSFDNISISESDLWSLLVEKNPSNFSEFISVLYNSNISFSRESLGKLLEGFKLSADSLEISSLSDNYADRPTFTWNKNGYDVYYNGTTFMYGNDTFDMVFFDESKREIATANNIYGNSYTISQSIWNEILKAPGNIYYAVLKSYDTLGVTSGPYYSDYYAFTKPTEARKSLNLSNLRYHEEVISIAANTYWYFTMRFDQPGAKLIATLGGCDTKMWLYDSEGTLLGSDDDSGYSLNAQLFKDLSSDKEYVLKVGMFSTFKSGDTKLIIFPVYDVKESGHASLETYESIANIQSTNFKFYSFLTPYYSEVIRFTPPEAGNYTISLDSTFDNYLYVMDPRESTANVLNVNYNDDFNGSRNASITRQFEKGIEYLILYAQYNPSRPFDNLDEGDDIALSIYKN